MGPSSRSSLTPVTVTDWGRPQLSGVNVRSPGDTAPSVGSVLYIAMVTLLDGRDSRTTANVACAPCSVVRRGAVAVTTTPGSLSRMVTSTASSATPSYV